MIFVHESPPIFTNKIFVSIRENSWMKNLFPAALEEDGADDDGTGEHQASCLAHRIDA